MALKDRRIEMRADPDSTAKIAEAARIVDKSTSTFIRDAATAAADQVLARVDHVMMPAEQFDTLLRTLDIPDVAPQLARIASRERRFKRA